MLSVNIKLDDEEKDWVTISSLTRPKADQIISKSPKYRPIDNSSLCFSLRGITRQKEEILQFFWKRFHGSVGLE